VCEPDGGMSEAINKGFRRASGDWVMWLNADDRLKPGALAEVARFVSGRTDLDVVFGSFDFIGEDGAFLRRVPLLPWSRFISVHHCCYVPSTAAFYRRTTVLGEGHFLREDFHCVMDGEYFARLDREGKRFTYLPVVLAEFRLHGGNASMRYLDCAGDMDRTLAVEHQHAESRAIRRIYGITLFRDPYLNGLVDGILWIAGGFWKWLRRSWSPRLRLPGAVKCAGRDAAAPST
jgi:glycosyltransferase involved in cell wall biosynthesis